VTFRFLSPAEREIEEAVEYYEAVSSGLGLEFLEEVERTIVRILKHPSAWAKVSERQRRCRTRRFPYGLIYAVQDDAVVITAVMNLRRHPDSWRGRVE